MTRPNFTAAGTILLAATLATLPLLLAGPSCGHDLTFHLLNWMDAAHQWSHGTLRPWWAAAAAWNTGEARFLFYPPLSWILGALLTLLVGATHAPAAFTWIALALSGFIMRRFLAHYVPPPLALLGACLYLTHPYMLFTATERTAYAELLAAAWLPWLLHEALRSSSNGPQNALTLISTGAGQLHRPAQWRNLHFGPGKQAKPAPTEPGVPHVPLLGHGFNSTIHPTRLAIPIALLWLTNTPAAVLATYTLAIIVAIRTTIAVRNKQPILRPLLLPTGAAYLLGLLLSAWYLLPALAEHNAVEVAQAFTAGMQPEEATLFTHNGQPLHDHVVSQASWLAIALLTTAAIAAATHLAFRRAKVHTHHGMRDAALATHHAASQHTLYPVLLILTAVVLFLLTPASLFLWHHAPELHFLQFPWRTLMLQGVLTTTLIVLAIRTRIGNSIAIPVALAAVLAMSFAAHHSYAQPCDEEDAPSALLTQYNTGAGFEPYDEYTPHNADNDLLHPGEPPAWTTANATATAPTTVTSRIVAIDTDRSTEHILQVQPNPGDHFVIIRQRRFLNWHVLLDNRELLTEDLRDDDLLAIPLPNTAEHTITLQYRWSWDQTTGLVLSLLTAFTLALLPKRLTSG